jgi:coenzyme F420 hydrogenase subunit beta
LRFEATWHESAASRRAAAADAEADGVLAQLSAPAPNRDVDLGVVRASYSVRAKDPHLGIQDGGAVSALLVSLLEACVIDGALVSKPSEDPSTPWKGVPTIATNAEEVRAAAGSFYNQTMGLAALDLAATDVGPNPRIAVVGTPCEVQGLRAMQLRPWSTGAHRVDAVVLTVALLCTKSFDYESLILRELQAERHVDLARVSKVDITRGRMIVEYADGAVAVDEPVREFHGASLKGCSECSDFLGRAADISMGSVGSDDGWTSVIVRTPQGRDALESVRDRLEVRELDDLGALVRLDQLNKKTADHALRRRLDPEGPMFIDYESHVRARTRPARQAVRLRGDDRALLAATPSAPALHSAP